MQRPREEELLAKSAENLHDAARLVESRDPDVGDELRVLGDMVNRVLKQMRSSRRK